MPSSQANSMFLNECSEDEVNTIIREIQNGKSSDIPIGVIKKTSKIISPILSSHFNYLMEVGKFPNELKLGKITPIYKKESDDLLENYRPVSTLPIFEKIFEKIIYSRLNNYFVSKGILHDRQFGFRKQHSTSHALNYSIDKIKQSIDHVLRILIDVSKAFDTIDHKILINKLNHYSFRGNTLSLTESYLSNRKQCVSSLGEISEQLAVIFGVPQRNGKETRLLTPNPSKNFLYVGSLIWSAVRDLIKLYEFSQNSGSAKCVLKREILKIQKGCDPI